MAHSPTATILALLRLPLVIVETQSASDVELMVAVASGDQNALATIYDRYAGLLLAVGERMLGAGRIAEDVMQDVFIEVWQRAYQYDPKRGTVRAWLLLRMRSRCIDAARSCAESRKAQLDAREPVSTDQPIDVEADRELIRRKLSDLSEDHRTVLWLSYFEGFSSSEIATKLRVPVSTVKSRISAARATLRKLIEKPSEAS